MSKKQEIFGQGFLVKRGGEMKALLIYGGFILFEVVIITLAVLLTKYSKKHNPYGWYM